jgi:hypothetical protein
MKWNANEGEEEEYKTPDIRVLHQEQSVHKGKYDEKGQRGLEIMLLSRPCHSTQPSKEK